MQSIGFMKYIHVFYLYRYIDITSLGVCDPGTSTSYIGTQIYWLLNITSSDNTWFTGICDTYTDPIEVSNIISLVSTLVHGYRVLISGFMVNIISIIYSRLGYGEIS